MGLGQHIHFPLHCFLVVALAEAGASPIQSVCPTQMMMVADTVVGAVPVQTTETWPPLGVAPNSSDQPQLPMGSEETIR